jgi:hypothetical protein
MLCLGDRVVFILKKDDEEIERPKKHALLHDPWGKAWPKNVLLIGPFAPGPRVPERDVPDEVRRFLGRGAVIHRGSTATETLPKHLGAWEKVGVLADVCYMRYGTREPGPHDHKFERMGLMRLFYGRRSAVLYELGAWRRIQLPPNARIDERGILYP